MTLRIYCPSCQADLRTDSEVCPKCGFALSESELRKQEAQAESPGSIYDSGAEE